MESSVGITMKVINFFAGPSAGKSTIAAALFHKMKIEGFNVELVTEFAKDIVYDERFSIFKRQDYMFAQQRHRLERLRGKVDFVITDSPLLLIMVYSEDQATWRKSTNDLFKSFIYNVAVNEYDNINLFIQRPDKGFRSDGRIHDLEDSIRVDKSILTLFERYNIQHSRWEATPTIHEEIYKFLLQKDINK
ncbi:MAG: AAA family ATPase [Candidatus Nitrosomaritimum aestuariumsis]